MAPEERQQRRDGAQKSAASILLEQGHSFRFSQATAVALVVGLESAADQMARWHLVLGVLELPSDQVTPWLEQHGYAPVRGATVGGAVSASTRSGRVH